MPQHKKKAASHAASASSPAVAAVLEACAHLDAGRPRRARDATLRAVEEDPACPAALLLLSRTLAHMPFLFPRELRPLRSSRALLGAAVESATSAGAKYLWGDANSNGAAPAPATATFLEALFRERVLGEAPDELLEATARQGSPFARCVLGERIISAEPERAEQLLEAAAKSGDAQASYALGRWHSAQGREAEAARHVRQAADHSHAAAQALLAAWALAGRPPLDAEPAAQRSREAVRLLQLAEAQGSAVAAHGLAVCYHRGLGVLAPDAAEAVRLYRAAAARAAPGSPLLDAAARGVVVDADDAEPPLSASPAEPGLALYLVYATLWAEKETERRAVGSLERAAAAGHAEASLRLAMLLEVGKIVEKDPARALALYRAASDAGLAAGQYRLAACLFQGACGAAADERAAFALASLAAAQGDATARSLVGLCLDKGRGAPRDPAASARMLRLASDQGSEDAQFLLGRSLAASEDAAQRSQGAELLARAARSGEHAEALFQLAECHAGGVGVERSDREAVRLYGLAAAKGSANAMAALGRCYETGTGVARNPREAARLYESAAQQGHEAAMCLLGMLVEARDPARAVQLYEKAADAGCVAAHYRLGLCLEAGVGVQRDEGLAAGHFQMAAAQGHEEAAEAYAKYIDVEVETL
eukprot:m51a1_g10377 putative transcription elongation factor (652) ;mRNA; f:20705-22908